jgi:hypothetical protein
MQFVRPAAAALQPAVLMDTIPAFDSWMSRILPFSAPHNTSGRPPAGNPSDLTPISIAAPRHVPHRDAALSTAPLWAAGVLNEVA